MKIVFTGGGTGGHVYPALAIYSAYKKRFPNAKFYYVGTNHGLESSVVPNEDLEFIKIDVFGFKRKICFENFKRLYKAYNAMRKMKRFLKNESIDLVIGTGGYVSGPVLYAASKLKIPTMIHEQNVFPGLTNRFLAKRVTKVAISFEESKKHFKSADTFLVGNPIRTDEFSISREVARTNLKLDKDEFFIVSFGGSGGHIKLNNSILEYLENTPLKANWIHITGKKHFEDFSEKLKSIRNQNKKNFKAISYSNNTPELITAADLVIVSAGAIAISEICAAGVASLLVPKAYTTNNHQEFNAKMIKSQKAGEMILEKDLNGKILKEMIENCFYDREKNMKYRINSKKIAKFSSADDIVNMAELILEENK